MAATPVSVVTNSFVIKSLPTRTYYQYDVVFKSADAVPQRDPKPEQRQRLIHAFQVTVHPDLFKPRAIYDGNRLLYSSKIIDNGVFRVHGSNQNAERNARGWWEVIITRTVGEPIMPSNVQKLMERGEATVETTTAINLLQLLLSQDKNQNNPNNGRAFYVPDGKQPLRGMAVELWRGYYHAVRPSIGRMLVTVDTTVSAMYMAGPLIDVCLAVLNTRDTRRLAIQFSDHDDYKALLKHLKYRLIHVKTPGSNKLRTKTVRDIVPAPVGEYRFHNNEGEPTTIAAHFHKAYQITLRHPQTIGVVTSGKNAPFKVVLPLEVCALAPGQVYKKKLPPDATATVVGFAAMPPKERLRLITTGGSTQQQSPIQDYDHSQYLLDAGMMVDKEAIHVRGRQLNVPTLQYNGKPLVPRDGAWNVVGARFFKAQTMKSWAILNFDTRNIPEELTHKTAQQLANCCSQLGMTVARPTALRTCNPQDVERALKQICQDLGGPQQVDMIVVLLPAKADLIRSRVKYACDVALGVRSQCLREPKLQRANNQYFNNVALKLNARLGGCNATVDSPALKELKSRPFIIMGADVSHAAPGENRPSVASLVWSHDMDGAAYCATSSVQLPRTEMIVDLQTMVDTALTMFGQKHKRGPASIVFFRDGVSEGEFDTVKKEEIKAVQEAIDTVWTKFKVPEPKPKLTFMVVGKRHHVSFFPRSPQEGDKTGNCRAGLAVDTDMASPQFVDFYLQSHAAIKGMSRSAHYTVLQDEVFGGDIKKLQDLSFALCHIYAKATRSVSIPAPVYYADLACARGKFHIDPNSNMDFEGSVSSGGQTIFSLDPWKDAFKPINNGIRGAMYFL
ncbi:Argonaute-like protein [Favolaschia claudopus]|uniref:Argonaute-like protein n=1 Tax=Favolaschia claudopus TaxID=2862362 RepID=A0AAW0BBW2_9AGAR